MQSEGFNNKEDWVISSQAALWVEGSTTNRLSRCTPKWVETGTIREDEDIVCSLGKLRAVL